MAANKGLSEAKKDTMVRLFQRGWSRRRIAARYQCSHQNIDYHLKARGAKR